MLSLIFVVFKTWRVVHFWLTRNTTSNCSLKIFQNSNELYQYYLTFSWIFFPHKDCILITAKKGLFTTTNLSVWQMLNWSINLPTAKVFTIRISPDGPWPFSLNPLTVIAYVVSLESDAMTTSVTFPLTVTSENGTDPRCLYLMRYPSSGSWWKDGEMPFHEM